MTPSRKSSLQVQATPHSSPLQHFLVGLIRNSLAFLSGDLTSLPSLIVPCVHSSEQRGHWVKLHRCDLTDISLPDEFEGQAIEQPLKGLHCHCGLH